MTLRGKLLTTVLSLVALALVFSDIASVAALRTYLLDQLDKDLVEGRAAATQRLENDTHTIARNNDQQLLNDFYVEIRERNGTVDDRLLPSVHKGNDPAPNLQQNKIVANVDKGPFTVPALGETSVRYRVVALTAPDNNIIVVAVSMHDFHNALDRLILTETLVTLAVLIGLGLAGWVIVRAELRPLDTMAKTAGAIAAGDLSQRVDETNPKTEVGRLGEALNSMLTQIEASFAERAASEERLRRFAADASHELRTPLTAIRGYAELFRQGAINDQEHLARVLHRIEREATRMGLMVEDLLLLARIDQNRPFEIERVNLVNVINEVIDDARAITDDHTINKQLDADQIEIDGDAARLHQVFANLVGNAISHTPPGTEINISAARDGDSVKVRVQDNGPGLDQSQSDKIFERFYRVDEGRSRDKGGTGLGLAIVKSIVDQHGGSVELEPVDEGASFVVTLKSLTGVDPHVS